MLQVVFLDGNAFFFREFQEMRKLRGRCESFIDEDFPREAAEKDARRFADSGLYKVDVVDSKMRRDFKNLVFSVSGCGNKIAGCGI